jgi:adenylate kinase family enzyme
MQRKQTKYNEQLISNERKQGKNKEATAREGLENPLAAIERDLTWLQGYCDMAMRDILSDDQKKNKFPAGEKSWYKQLKKAPKPDTNYPYDQFLKTYNLHMAERIAVLTAIAPYFSPSVLKSLSMKDPATQTPFPEVGGTTKNGKNEFIPTIDTIRFLLTGNQIKNIYYADHFLKRESRLVGQNIVNIVSPNGETAWNKCIVKPSDEFLALIRGEKYEPSYSSQFPASRITTPLDWEDLILPYDTYQELKEVSIWLNHKEEILKHPQLNRIIKPGFRTLFYGPPGTGKTLTASLLGKTTGLDVYRIDLSMVVSKWVGETEKNLKRIFDQAENKNWILFFDEADSLFGKRTQTKSSNDRYANQEVAYLLQRIEDFPGLVVLATNLKDNIDEAFSRRFQSMVYFPIPDTETRYTLWQRSLPSDFSLDEDIDLYQVADEHEISGGIIVNVVRYCVLMALDEGRKVILAEDLENGISKELKKGGKIVG